MYKGHIQTLTLSGLLIAIGIVIPMFSPVKIVIEPASFTLASHVAIFIAMFISPAVAVVVAIGTTAGFFLGSFPVIIVLRAATHVIFVTLGAFYLHKISKNELSAIRLRIFSFFIALIHALAEVIIVSAFYFGGNISDAYQTQGFFMSVFVLVGLGTVAHGMADFEIARLIIYPLQKSGLWRTPAKKPDIK